MLQIYPFSYETVTVKHSYVTVTSEESAAMNCEPLSEDLQVSWSVTEDSIMMELAGRIGKLEAALLL